MRFVRPEVFLVAKSVPNPRPIAEWLKSVGCSEDVVHLYSDNPDAKHDGERIIELAGRRCYLSFEVGLNPNVTRIRSDIAEYCENILKAKHGSVLEHAHFTFAIEGVSRVFTGEMNRHRAGVAISEGSMRYIRYTDIPIVEVDSLIPDDPDPEINALIEQDREDVRAHAEMTEVIYARIAERWKSVLDGKDFTKKKHLTSRMRRIIPMGVATGGLWTLNIRALRHVCTMRCAESAEEEIAVVAGKMLEIMMKEEPSLFGDFHMDGTCWKPKYDKV